MTENSEKYQSIIDLSRPLSARRKCGERADRAAQFAPFAAIEGYDKKARETARSEDIQDFNR